MDKTVRDFLINMVASSFSDIGYALRILLGNENTDKDSIISKVERADDRVKALKAIADKTAEERSNNNLSAESVSSVKEMPEAEKETEQEESPVCEDSHEGALAKSGESTKIKEETKPEAPKHKTTIVEVRKIMTELSRKGKGKVIQDVLSKDFNVTKLSDIKEEDYDDFVTRVLYYADEKDAFVEVENA